MEKMIPGLAKTAVFKNMSAAEIIQVLNTVHYQVRTYRSDDIIAYAGEECEDLFILIEGKVRGEMSNFEGKNIVISEIPAPNSFAEGFLFAKNNKLKINIRAVSDSRVLFIQKSYFSQLLSENRKVLENYLRIISNRFVIVTEKLNFLMIKNVKGKLAYYITNRENSFPGKKHFPLGKTHEELAIFLGIARPVVTRNLLEMKKQGIISIEKKMIRIKDRQRLMELIN